MTVVGRTVVIVDYTPDWADDFLRERDRLDDAVGALVTGIEHIGSTAVPSLAAKPILDIMIGVRRLDDAGALIAPLRQLNYVYVPEYERQIPDRRYFRKDTDGVRSHHLHMVEDGGAFWTDKLLFRDYLRAHEDIAREYEALKRGLAQHFHDDRAAYTEAKAPFIARVLAQARGNL